MKRVRLVSVAEQEMLDAADYYEQQMKGLGADFYNMLEIGFSAIGENPECWPIVTANIRRCLIRRFPYCLLYRVDSEEVVVLAVMHLSRHPLYWRRRK
jgi:plasmid stabilization system protein ParE